MYRRELDDEARPITEGHRLFAASLAERWQAFCRLLRPRGAKRDRSDPPLNLML